VNFLRFALLVLVMNAGTTVALAAQEDRFDPRVRDMLLRAELQEKPTFQDQRTAYRALRDWRLSEQRSRSGEREIPMLLEYISRGEAPPMQLRSTITDLKRRYLTREGRERRLREGIEGRMPGRPAVARNAELRELPDSAEYWFLFITCLAIMIGGIVVWFMSRRRSRPDYRSYYS